VHVRRVHLRNLRRFLARHGAPTLALMSTVDASLSQSLDRLSSSITDDAGAYLFFIGTTCIALLLLARKRWIWAKLAFVLGLAWIVFYQSLIDYLNSLGVDSFAEAKSFNVGEALFWFRTMNGQLHAQLSIVQLLLYLAAAVGTFFFLKWLLNRFDFTARNYSFLKFAVAALIVAAGIHQTVYRSLALFLSNSESFLTTSRHFSGRVPRLTGDRNAVTVLLYIGESTSVLNMGVYGYPRDTTPHLASLAANDPGLLVFENVFSTHTHTSQSLLEALSFALDKDENWLPINERRRLSIVDVLDRNGLPVLLFSNQGMSGTSNQASSIVFRRARAAYSVDTHASGDLDYYTRRPWDHVYFARKVQAELNSAAKTKRLIVFHSYAGHGPYREWLPQSFTMPVDAWFAATVHSSSDGDIKNIDDLRREIDGYDSAISYVDYCVSRAIAAVSAAAAPTIFIYFSDHGESVFTDQGHDSSRFKHEMARVPFLVYFNPAMSRLEPDLVERYRQLSQRKNTATLAQLPSTILDLMGLRMPEGQKSGTLLTPGVGENASLPPIIVRRTQDGITYVNINPGPLKPTKRFKERFLDNTDQETKIFAFNANKAPGTSSKCYEVSDSFAKRIRSRLISDCVLAEPGSAEPAALPAAVPAVR